MIHYDKCTFYSGLLEVGYDNSSANHSVENSNLLLPGDKYINRRSLLGYEEAMSELNKKFMENI